ncbi:hypothetical protein ANN_20926 [Periplaneta americana]|uniref:Transmembrane protein n=1 Tax=Periplaneta americana TaxID=6978 RepID=A0ABQ8SF81_PERAM|nr:hypothetical protein ANN_20926 [Periplaneta americana]
MSINMALDLKTPSFWVKTASRAVQCRVKECTCFEVELCVENIVGFFVLIIHILKSFVVVQVIAIDGYCDNTLQQASYHYDDVFRCVVAKNSFNLVKIIIIIIIIIIIVVVVD